VIANLFAPRKVLYIAFRVNNRKLQVSRAFNNFVKLFLQTSIGRVNTEEIRMNVNTMLSRSMRC